MSILVDTDLVIDGLNGLSNAVQALRGFASQRIAVSTVTLAEIIEGAFHTSDPSRHLTDARAFLSPYAVLDVTDPVAETFGEIRAGLRRQGNLIADMDLLIAATALTHDLTLLTRNTRHFTRIPGLRLQQPAL